MKYLVEDCDNPSAPVDTLADAVSRARAVFYDHPCVVKAAIFGSFSRSEQKASSDVDLLLQVDEKNAFEVIDIGLDLAERLGRDVDMLTTLRGAQSSFIDNLKREGRLIYIREQ